MRGFHMHFIVTLDESNTSPMVLENKISLIWDLFIYRVNNLGDELQESNSWILWKTPCKAWNNNNNNNDDDDDNDDFEKIIKKVAYHSSWNLIWNSIQNI